MIDTVEILGNSLEKRNIVRIKANIINDFTITGRFHLLKIKRLSNKEIKQ